MGFRFSGRDEFRNGQETAISFQNFTFMGEVKTWQFYLFDFRILPIVHFRPVAQWENPKVFTGALSSVEQVPKFGSLIFRVPLTKGIAVREKAFFGPGFFLVSSSPAQAGVQRFAINCFKKGYRLKALRLASGPVSSTAVPRSMES